MFSFTPYTAVIAFGGRTLRKDKNIAKYINSPESEILYTSKNLLRYLFCQTSIQKLQKCYFVEGYTDVIHYIKPELKTLWPRAEHPNTEQIRMIKRFSPQVTVLYDGDAAGIKASIRGIDMLLEEGLQVKVVLFPDGEDPDSYARKHSKEELSDFLKNSEQDFIAFKTSLLAEETKKDPIKRAQLISEVVASIAVIPDAISRTVYIEDAVKAKDRRGLLSDEVKKLRKKRQYGAYASESVYELNWSSQYFPDS